MKTKSKITNNHITLTKKAALRHGKELSRNEAYNQASKILELMETADSDNAYGQDFWTAAKEFFTNPL